MIVYRASFTLNEIAPIAADKLTEKSVFLKDRVASRVSTYAAYFQTFEEAQKSLIDNAESEIETYENMLNRAKQKKAEAQKLNKG